MQMMRPTGAQLPKYANSSHNSITSTTTKNIQLNKKNGQKTYIDVSPKKMANRHTKSCSVLLIIIEMHTKTTKWCHLHIGQNQFSSVSQLSPTLRDPMESITSGFPVPHQLRELAQTHAHRFSDAIQPSHSLLLLLLGQNGHHQKV